MVKKRLGLQQELTNTAIPDKQASITRDGKKALAKLATTTGRRHATPVASNIGSQAVRART